MHNELPKAQIVGSAVPKGADLSNLCKSKNAAVNTRGYRLAYSCLCIRSTSANIPASVMAIPHRRVRS